MEDVLSSKSVSDNKKKPRRKAFCLKYRPVMMGLVTDCKKIKNVTSKNFLPVPHTRSNNSLRSLL